MTSEEFIGRSAEMRVSPWLAAEDIDGLGDVKVTIAKVRKHANVEFEQGRKKEVAYSLGFEGKQRELLLNSTNRKTITAMFGPEIKDWKGKSITLYIDPNVKLKGQTVKGIRIRNK